MLTSRGCLCEERPEQPHARHGRGTKNLQQDTAKPISQGGGTSRKTYLKAKHQTGRRREKNKVRKSSMDSEVTEKGGAEGASATRADIPLQPMDRSQWILPEGTVESPPRVRFILKDCSL